MVIYGKEIQVETKNRINPNRLNILTKFVPHLEVPTTLSLRSSVLE